VRFGERKRCQVVIEVCRFPSSGCMTGSAIVVEVTLDVIGILGRCEFVLMAIIAGSRCAGVTGSVTRDAGCRNMRACKSESRLVVVEVCRLPGRRRMTLGTIVIEIVRGVIRVFHQSEIVLMTTIAGSRRAGVAGRVAEVARH